MSVCKIYRLQGYARRISPSEQKLGEWEYFDDKENTLELTITTTSHLLIHHGKTQMESLCFSDSKTWLKGMSKGDSLMIIIKMKRVSRQFRMKFLPEKDKTAEGACKQCVDLLSEHFQIKILEGNKTIESSQTQLTLSGQSTTELEDLTLGQLAEAITKPCCERPLPSVYDHLSIETNLDFDTMIKLCLSDPLFPAFVNTVEKHLENIVKDN